MSSKPRWFVCQVRYSTVFRPARMAAANGWRTVRARMWSSSLPMESVLSEYTTQAVPYQHNLIAAHWDGCASWDEPATPMPYWLVSLLWAPCHDRAEGASTGL